MNDPRPRTHPSPGEGQESVWDYPRPPRIEPLNRRARVEAGGHFIADSVRAYRVLETSHPPAIYIPPDDVRLDLLHPAPQRSFCEFKGEAHYWDLILADRVVSNVAWSYPTPAPGYETIAGYLAFYPGRVDACFLDDERVEAQAGDFYGGWITAEIIGPFKGGPGTRGW